MKYRSYRDIRRGDVIRIPGVNGEHVVVSLFKRPVELGHKISLITIRREDVGVNNAVNSRYELGVADPKDQILSVYDLEKVTHLKVMKESKIVLKTIMAGP